MKEGKQRRNLWNRGLQVMCLALAITASAFAQHEGKLSTSGNCSPIIVGSANQINKIDCINVSPAKINKMIRLLTRDVDERGTPGPSGRDSRTDPLASAEKLYRRGKFSDAFTLFTDAAASENADAMLQLGVMFEKGQGTSQDYDEAKIWYSKAAKAGNSSSMVKLGELLAFGGETDPGEATRLFESAAEVGNPEAEEKLGLLYLNGIGVERDVLQARHLFEKASEAGYTKAFRRIGETYEYAIPPDYNQARKWYEKGVASRDASSSRDIGLLYSSGEGVTRDFAQARIWFERGATAEDTYAMTLLGELYQEGLGVPQDFAHARRWYERAASANDLDGMTALAWIIREA
jgi:TPR repeat protein